jgi:tetratricopeptide (TPR) repeat protein
MRALLLSSLLLASAARAQDVAPPEPGTATTPASRFMSAPPEPKKSGPRLVLDVLLVNDPDFPAVTAQSADTILRAARDTLADKLSFPNVEFRIIGESTVADFIRRNVPEKDVCSLHFEPLRVRFGKRAARDVDPKLVDEFLSRWSVESLAAFFPEKDRAGLTSYEAIRTKLLEEFDRKVAMIAGFQDENGDSLLAPDKLEQRSYVSWICAIRNQNEADFILTNEFILYDLASEPYPHSIFQKCKMGGASLLSPKRRAIHRRALVASTFSMFTELPFFVENGVEWLTTRERLEVIGTFIVAHEMGHAVFKIPDFYDHPPECLMTTKFETGYVSGWRELGAHPGPCPDCQLYVDAKNHVFLAYAARMEGQFDDVIKNLKIAIRKTPKHTDGSYLRYIADLSVQIAETFAAKGSDKQAKRWLKAALRIVPEHEEALQLRAALKKN